MHATVLLSARFQEMSITFISHPMRAREMAVVYPLRTYVFLLRIEAEDDCNGLAPIRTFGLGVEQPNVARQVFLIIRTDAIKSWWLVFKGRNGHMFARCDL